MGHTVLTHCLRSLIWLPLLHIQTCAPSRPGTEPDACKVHQSNLGVCVWNTAMLSLPAPNGEAETAPLDRGERGSSVPEMSCFPTEIDRSCGEEESAPEFKLPLAPYENGMDIQAEGGNSCGTFQHGGSRHIVLETVLSYGSHGYSTSEEQVQTPAYQIPLQQGSSETEQQGVCRPALERTMMKENARDSLILLPSEIADQSVQVYEFATTVGDCLPFEAGLRKETTRSESGQPSRQHDAIMIPLAEILSSPVEGTVSDAGPFSLMESTGLGTINKDISSTGDLQTPAATSVAIVRDLAARNGGTFEKFSSEFTQSSLVKNSGRPRSGGPSKGHN